MKKLQTVSLEVLTKLELNANIQYFAKQWSEENGLNNLEDLLALFDRIQLPYVLVPDLKQTEKSKYKWVLAVASDTEISLGYSESGVFKAQDDQQSVSSAKFYVQIENAPLEKPQTDWVGERLHAFRPLIPKLLLISFVSNLFALSIPFITMSIYDHVIGGDAGHELQGIAIGAALLFFMMGLLRIMRSKVFTIVSNRLSREISQAIVLKLLNNNYSVNQQNTTTSQYSQTQLAERLSGVLSGPLGNALFDLPFVLLFILAMGILGGYIVAVPIIAVLLYFVVVMRYLKVSSKRVVQSTVAGTNRQNMLNELTAKLGFMRSSGMLNHWMQRFEKANHLAAKSGFAQTVVQSRYTSLYYLINVGSTLAIMGLGIDLIFENVMTAGGLIAAMMLISKVTGPLQMLANSVMRLQSFQQSKLQLNRIMLQPSERSFTYQHHPLKNQAPSLVLDQLTLRYPKQPKPALSGVSFDVLPGEIVAIVGPSGCGKTTLMEVISGLVAPQNGLVQLNGVNLSQYDPQLYRHWCFIRSAQPDLIMLSLREWLSDGRELSDQTMIDAINEVNGEAWFNSLTEGLDSNMSAMQADSMFELLTSFSAQILINAKALVHDYPLYLLDNPVPDSHPQSKQVFADFIDKKRGVATTIYTSHDPEIIKLADKVVVLEEGTVVYAGPMEQEQQNEPELGQTEVING
jgi:ATP-binding cassette subfamily C protein/ATP-binding cassette subfamily C protein LapB